MAENRDPRIVPEATTTPPPRVTTSPTRGGMSRWIWIGLAALVVLLLLMWLFGGADPTTTAPAGDPAITDQSTAPPAADPAAPATEPAPAENQ